jgi:hypothetical protein
LMSGTYRDVFSSVVVFLVALPLCMGIAIASGAPPAAGLIAGIVGGIVTGALSGSPLQVTGPAAGLTVLVWDIVQTHGLAALGAIIVLAGLLQVAAGMLKLGQVFPRRLAGRDLRHALRYRTIDLRVAISPDARKQTLGQRDLQPAGDPRRHLVGICGPQRLRSAGVGSVGRGDAGGADPLGEVPTP